jgi:signal transduction histidine kinase/ActR/RegA family two-component response regulator
VTEAYAVRDGSSGRPSYPILEWVAMGLVLVAVAGYVGVELWNSRRAVETTERARLEHQSRIVEKRLGTRLLATVNALDSLRADAPAFLAQEDGLSRMDERMQVMVSAMAGVRTFLLVDARGIAVASNRRELVGTDWHEGERYRAIRSRPDAATVYVSPPFMTPLNNWALSLGRALIDPRGGFDGYVLAIIDPEYFQLLLDSARYAADMAAAMVHGGGKVIYRVPDPKGSVGMDLSERPESAFSKHVRSGRELSSWTARLSSSGAEALVVLRTIQPSPRSDGFLVAVFSRETSALFAPWRKELRDRLAALAVIGLGAVLGLHNSQRRRADRRRQEEARRTLQVQAAESQKLESIGRLAGGVAHDFNNLLTVILSCGLELRDTLRDGTPGDPELASDVLTAAQRAAELTGQLLAFARKQVISPEVVDLNDVLRQAHKLLGRVIGEDIRLCEELAEGLWPVRCDRGLIGQVIMNLAVNARDAMPTGGTLTLSTANLSLAPGDPLPEPELTPGRYVVLGIRDTGPGMLPEVLEHLFEPFFTTKGAGRGTGLGLATVYGIVKQSGGFVTVRSAPGEGTWFEVLLPATTPSRSEPARERARASGGSETILVVEDEPKVREIVVRALRSAGYRVLEAASGAEAVERERHTAEPIHLLLTDVVMPGLDGREAAERILAKRPGTRVLYVSGYTRDAINRHGVLDDGIDFISKPFTPDALRARVREVLDRAPRADARAPGQAPR